MLCAVACAFAQAGLALAQTAVARSPAPAAGSVIYKHVDENGRVTYANTPMRGAVRVELEPLTVIPSTPSGSLGQSAPSVNPPPAPLLIPVGPSMNAAAESASAPRAAARVPVAKVVPTGFKPANERIAVKSAPTTGTPADADDGPLFPEGNVSRIIHPARTAAAPAAAAGDSPATVHASPAGSPAPNPAETPARPLQLSAALSPDAAQKFAEQRRVETRKRLLEGEVASEEQMLAQAREALYAEQRQTQAYRAMRNSFAATSEAGAPAQAREQRAEFERHFERLRSLQDQIAMHEAHLQNLREQLAKVH